MSEETVTHEQPIADVTMLKLRVDAQHKWLTTLQARMDVLAESIPTFSDLAPLVGTCKATSDAPERYVRIMVTKNTKGYQGETTVSIRGTNWGADSLIDLLMGSDEMLREEIARREALDAAGDR